MKGMVAKTGAVAVNSLLYIVSFFQCEFAVSLSLDLVGQAVTVLEPFQVIGQAVMKMWLCLPNTVGALVWFP
jgi:hypothetical protein